MPTKGLLFTFTKAGFSLFIQLLLQAPEFYIAWVVLMMFSICIHEFSHSWIAHREGDSTAADGGYLTLNPLRVMGLQSLLCLALFGVAWGAVPVNPRRLRGPHSHALVAFAGPAANLLLALGFAGVVHAAVAINLAPVVMLAKIGVSANLFLLIFNLLPIPMLDGWPVYTYFITPLRDIPEAKARQFGMIVLLIVLLSGLFRYVWQASDYLAGFLI